MAPATECSTCGAPGATGTDECASCGAPGTGGPTEQAIPDNPPPDNPPPADLPPAQEARLLQGLAIPGFAALIVLGIGLPLTALAVVQVGRLPAGLGGTSGTAAPDAQPAGPATPTGRARLRGAVTFEGAASPIGCRPGALPKIVTLESGADRYSILVTVPVGSGAGSYPLQAAPGTFVALTRLAGGSQTWTSLNQSGATGTVTVAADRSFSAQFSGLGPSGGGAEGTVDGVLEADCG